MEVGEEGTSNWNSRILILSGWLKYCFTSTETVRLTRDVEKGGKGVRRWGGGEGDHIPIAILSPPE